MVLMAARNMKMLAEVTASTSMKTGNALKNQWHSTNMKQQPRAHH
jgi:hypothetical protein